MARPYPCCWDTGRNPPLADAIERAWGNPEKSRRTESVRKMCPMHGSLNVPMFHITQPLGINGLLDGYFFRWCPIFPSHGTVTPTPAMCLGQKKRFKAEFLKAKIGSILEAVLEGATKDIYLELSQTLSLGYSFLSNVGLVSLYFKGKS